MKETLCSKRAPYWADVPDEDWDDWGWQLSHRIRRPEQLVEQLGLTGCDLDTVRRGGELFPIGITPYYASLMDVDNLQDPIRLQSVPVAQELEVHDDDLEDARSIVENLAEQMTGSPDGADGREG